jgi:hypothetical protein
VGSSEDFDPDHVGISPDRVGELAKQFIERVIEKFTDEGFIEGVVFIVAAKTEHESILESEGRTIDNDTLADWKIKGMLAAAAEPHKRS